MLKLSSFKTELPAELMINHSVQNFIPCLVLLLYWSEMRSTKKKKKKKRLKREVETKENSMRLSQVKIFAVSSVLLSLSKEFPFHPGGPEFPPP